MRVLIVQSNIDLGCVWARHLERLGAQVIQVSTGAAALDAIATLQLDVIVLDLVLANGSALTIADFAQFTLPLVNIVFVTDTTFFSDGSIFKLCANARALVETTAAPDDLAAIVHHYGQDASRANAARYSLKQGSSE
jgi:DNA-binding response OmpR family regulator